MINFKLEPVFDIKAQEVLYYEVLLDNGIPNGVLFAHPNPELDIHLVTTILPRLSAMKGFSDHRFALNVFSETVCTKLDQLIPLLNTCPNILFEVIEDGTRTYPERFELHAERFILDDFGTRSSNFDRLNGRFGDCRYYAVKLDRVMLRQWHLLTQLRRLLEDRGIVPVFEKVESAKELERLSGIGFRYFQGYHINGIARQANKQNKQTGTRQQTPIRTNKETGSDVFAAAPAHTEDSPCSG